MSWIAIKYLLRDRFHLFFLRKEISEIEQRVERMERDITVLSMAPTCEEVYLKVTT